MDENNEDRPLSSEEMVRRARSGLGDSVPTPQADEMEDTYSSLEKELDFGIEPRAVEEPEPPAPRYEPPVPEPAEPEVAHSGVGSWAPPRSDRDAGAGGWAPPTEPDQGTWGGQLPVPGQPTKSGGGVGKIVILLLIVAGVGLAVYSVFDHSKTVEEMTVGECLDFPEKEEFSTYEPIDCTEPHDVEIFAIVDLATVSTDFSPGTPYPGDNPVFFTALDVCSGEPFESYVGVPYRSISSADTLLTVFAFTPTLEGWQEFDERRVQCVLFQQDSAGTQVVKSVGSFRGAGDTL